MSLSCTGRPVVLLLLLLIGAILLLLPLGCGGSSIAGPVDGGRAMQHVEQLVALGPRPAGSAALGKAADYIGAELKKLGLEAHRQEFTPANEKFQARNLWTQIDGKDPQNGPILCIGAHYDTKLADGQDGRKQMRFVGAIDGGGGPAVLLELARVLTEPQYKPEVNVWLLWIDAEESVEWEWNDDRALLGSKHFVAELAKEEARRKRVKAFVLLDLIGSKNIKIDKDGNSNPRLLEIVGQAAEKAGVKDRVYQYPTPAMIEEYTRRGLQWGTTDDHQIFTKYGIPSVLLIDFALRVPAEYQHLRPGQPPDQDDDYVQWWHTELDDLSAMSADSLAFAGNLVMAAFPDLQQYCLKK